MTVSKPIIRPFENGYCEKCENHVPGDLCKVPSAGAETPCADVKLCIFYAPSEPDAAS